VTIAWLRFLFMAHNRHGYGKCGILKPFSCPPTVSLLEAISKMVADAEKG